jgi:DNA-binding transcriptional LysR family regulator
MDDWNHPKLVLAIARTGSLTGAARELRINHSTAFRRLGALEAKLGVRLFDRLPGGAYEPTEAGRRMAAGAERIESEAAALDRDLTGADLRLTGTLRVTTAATVAQTLLTAQLARFQRAHPSLTIELSVDRRVLSLSRHEVDVAVRAMRPTEGDLFGRKLATIGWTIYGRRSEFGPMPVREALAALRKGPVIGWETGAPAHTNGGWIERQAGPGAVVYRTSSVVNHHAAAREGIGLAVLPCYMGDQDPELVRLTAPIAALETELWMVTHVDLKRTAKVRAFFEVVGEGIAAQRALIAGEAPGSLSQWIGEAADDRAQGELGARTGLQEDALEVVADGA